MNSTTPPSPAPGGGSVRWTARAPGRVNVIGEHVDYNDGWVLPMAIEREVVLGASPRPDRIATFTSGLLDERIEIDLADPSERELPHWGRYLQGVLEVFAQETATRLPGFDAHIDSTVPRGGGLSSSAALEVAAMTLLEKISGHALPPVHKALLCREVEHRYAGVPCGIMDQMASVLGVEGHLLLIDCATRDVRPIPLGDECLVVLVANTGVSHALADGEYARRRQECEAVLECLGLPSFRDLAPADLDGARLQLDPVLWQRARHVVTENARTLAAVAALEARDWVAVGSAMYASHESLAEDYEVSCPELDCLVDAARAIGPEGGVVGSRMTGGGFGGCTVTLAWQDRVAEVTARLQGEFEAAFGHKPACFVTRPAQGAG